MPAGSGNPGLTAFVYVLLAVKLAALVGLIAVGLRLRRRAEAWLLRRLDLRCPYCRAGIAEDGEECDNGHPVDQPEDGGGR